RGPHSSDTPARQNPDAPRYTQSATPDAPPAGNNNSLPSVRPLCPTTRQTSHPAAGPSPSKTSPPMSNKILGTSRGKTGPLRSSVTKSSAPPFCGDPATSAQNRHSTAPASQ